MNSHQNDKNPLSYITPELQAKLARAMYDANHDVEKNFSAKSWPAVDQMGKSNLRRAYLIGSLIRLLTGEDGIDIVRIQGVPLFIINRRVVLYFRKVDDPGGEKELVCAEAPKLFGLTNTVLIQEDPRVFQHPLIGWEELLEIQPDLEEKIASEDELLLKNVDILLCGYVGVEPGLIQKIVINPFNIENSYKPIVISDQFKNISHLYTDQTTSGSAFDEPIVYEKDVDEEWDDDFDDMLDNLDGDDKVAGDG